MLLRVILLAGLFLFSNNSTSQMNQYQDINKTYMDFPTKDNEYVHLGTPEEFSFLEQEYTPAFKIEYVSRKEKKDDLVEDAVVSRFSAIAALDFEWWKQEWASRYEADEAIRLMLSQGKTRQDMLKGWGDIVAARDIFLTKKISYGDYRIIMYKLVRKGAKKMRGFEIPMVLKKVGDDWKVTTDLKASPLVRNAPWISGKYSVMNENQIWVVR